MLNSERLTIKSAEAIQSAISEASRRGNPALEDLHVLNALLTQDETVVTPILQKVGANISRLQEALTRALDRLPKQTGGSSPTVSRELNQIFDVAQAQATSLKDEYVSTEHLLLGLAGVKGSSARDLLAEQGVSLDDLKEALEAVRGSHRVTDQNPEEKYRAVERFTKDLTEIARRGKLDPVIGRDEEIR